MNDHKEYDQQRALQKLEQQRQQALRDAARRAKTPEQAKREQAALNAFYNNRRNSMPGSAGHKVKPCAVLLLAGGATLATAAAGFAAAVRAFI